MNINTLANFLKHTKIQYFNIYAFLNISQENKSVGIVDYRPYLKVSTPSFNKINVHTYKIYKNIS